MVPEKPFDLSYIEELARQGSITEAAKLCRQLVDSNPADVDGWFALGVLSQMTGENSASELAFRNVVERKPDNSDAWSNLSSVLNALGRFLESEECARRAITIRPDNAVQWLNLGSALACQKKLTEAQDAYHRSADLNPDEDLAWFGIGVVEEELGHLHLAREAYLKSLSLKPTDERFAVGYGRLLNRLREPKESLTILRPVIDQSSSATAWVEWGTAHRILGDLQTAESAYYRALELDPDHEEAQHYLALTLLSQDKIGQSEEWIRRLLASKPLIAPHWTLLGENLRAQGRVDEAVDAFRHSLVLEPSAERHSKLLLSLQCLNEIDAGKLLVEHREWNTKYASGSLPTARTIASSGSHRPLRIGFISGDFGAHPTAWMVLPAIECLDKRQGTTLCYSDRVIEDEYTLRFRSAASEWRSTAGLSNDELAALVSRDNIDVLIDLAGHAGKRLVLFAHRPAPLQLTWFGYPGTTGLAEMDFLLADRYHILPSEESYFAERILRMPNDYGCYRAPPECPNVAPLPALSSRNTVFGCFNNPAKYSPTWYDHVASLLHRLKSARLFLKYIGLGDSASKAVVRRAFTARGIDEQRLMIEGPSGHPDLLASYNRVDIALDTQPYSGGVTTCEALWMGVPVITFPGKTFAGRHATSHLMNAGFPQFVAKDFNAYVDLAVEWANRLDELAVLRLQMREQTQNSPLCDAPRFARDFLNVIQQAWQMKMGAK